MRIGNQPERGAKVVVGRGGKALTGTHHHPTGFQCLGHVQIWGSSWIAGIEILTDQITTLGGKNGNAVAQMFAVERVKIFIGQPTGRIIHDRGPGIAAVMAQAVDLIQRPTAPGIFVPPLFV